jgi:type 1 glutamine amidotransferase
VRGLIFHVQTEHYYRDINPRRRVRATFTYNETKYKLSVTDPVILTEFLSKSDGDYHYGEAALCVSLAEVWKEFSYRVVASVITPKRCEIND